MKTGKMTNENVRLNSSFFSYKNRHSFLTANYFLQEFFHFYILSYQHDSEMRTKIALLITKHKERQKKWLKKTYVLARHFTRIKKNGWKPAVSENDIIDSIYIIIN